MEQSDVDPDAAFVPRLVEVKGLAAVDRQRHAQHERQSDDHERERLDAGPGKEQVGRKVCRDHQ